MPNRPTVTLLTRLELERLISLHAIEDPEFRANLMEDPRTALEAVFHDALPEGFEVQMVERNPGALLVVVPSEAGTSELSDLELSAVAGGAGLPAPVKGGASLEDALRLQFELMQVNLEDECDA